MKNLSVLKKLIKEEILLIESNRRATDFFEDNKHGVALHKLFGGKFNDQKFDDYLDKLESKSVHDSYYARILDSIGKDVGLDPKRYENSSVKSFIDDIKEKTYHLYKDYTTDKPTHGLDPNISDMPKHSESDLADGIAFHTGLRGTWVAKVAKENDIDLASLYDYLQKGKLADRKDVATAFSGNPNNKFMKSLKIKLAGGTPTTKPDKQDKLIDKAKRDFANVTVKNPKTGNDIKLSSALAYDKKHPAFKAAVAIMKQGNNSKPNIFK